MKAGALEGVKQRGDIVPFALEARSEATSTTISADSFS
jgi:hypothetical protein